MVFISEDRQKLSLYKCVSTLLLHNDATTLRGIAGPSKNNLNQTFFVFFRDYFSVSCCHSITSTRVFLFLFVLFFAFAFATNLHRKDQPTCSKLPQSELQNLIARARLLSDFRRHSKLAGCR
jgi:hypothetical protein